MLKGPTSLDRADITPGPGCWANALKEGFNGWKFLFFMRSMADETYAFSRLDGAFKRTKSLLWPFRWGIWLRLALIALFIGGVSLPGTSDYNFGEGDLPPGIEGSLPGILPLVGVIILAALALVLIWMIVGAVMQFVFVDMLRTGDVHIRPFFGERLGKGLRLFLFEAGFAILLVLGVAALAVLLFVFSGMGRVPGAPLLLLVFIPAILVLSLIFGIIFLLTTDFVVPIMIREDCGVIEGWRRLIGVISTNVWQTLLYIILRLVLAFIAGIVQIVLIVLAMMVIAIPFILIGFVFLAAPMANILLLLALLIPYLVIAIPVTLLIMVPFVTFFRYYGLLVLEGLAPEYRLLPE